MSEYWTDENTSSTIILQKEENGVTTSIHLTVFRDDKETSDTTTERRYSGLMKNFDDNISANISVTPIVTYNAENAFAFDIQANESVSLSFVRKNPCNKIKVFDENSNEFVEQQLPWDGSTDDRHWSNRKWIAELSALVNRWQVETDGCVMVYDPLDPILQLAMDPSIDDDITHEAARNVYIHQFSHNFSVSMPEAVNGNLSLQIGSMTANAVRADDTYSVLAGYNEPIDMKDMTVRMTSSDGLAEYLLYCNNMTVPGSSEKKTMNCISSYTLKGGPEQPFEYLVMYISKKRLSIIAPNLVGDIIAGKNRITLNAMGDGEFVVTKVSGSNDYKIIAYSVNETYRSTALGVRIPFGANTTATPFDIIKIILATNRDSSGSELKPVVYTEDRIAYAFRKSNNFWSSAYECNFNNESSAWYVLSVCAIKLDCKIWFSDRIAYIVDTSLTADDLLNTNTISSNLDTVGGLLDLQNLYLNTSDPYPLSATPEEMKFPQSVCDAVKLGDEGAETIHNSLKVTFDKYKDGRDETSLKNGGYARGLTRTGVKLTTQHNVPIYTVDLSNDPDIAESQKKYGVKEVTYDIQEIGVDDANDIAIKVARSNCDSEQSIGFKLKEMHKEEVDGQTVKYWQKYFPTVTHVDTIYDYSHDLINTNMSNFKYSGSYHKMPNKLCLSTFTHNFPEGTTEYWFGIIKPTDVSQNSSEIANALYKQ